MTVFHNNTLKYYGTNILIEFSHPDMYTSSHFARTLTNSETNKKKMYYNAHYVNRNI